MEQEFFDLMEKYNLTLRRVPSEVITYSWVDTTTHKLINTETIKEEWDTERRSLKSFTPKPNHCWLKRTELKKGGWMAKIDRTHDATQKWDKKRDFWGETPQEAINRAVLFYQE